MRRLFVLAFIVLSTSGCALVARSALATGARPDPGQMLSNADTNGDGKITRSEFIEARVALFGRLDRNGDGYLDKQDARQRLLARRDGDGGRLQQAIVMFDKNGDGRISRDEFVKGPSLLFDRADTNHDGIIDAQELTAFRALVASRHPQQGGQ